MTRTSLMRHLRTRGHDTIGHGVVVLRFKQRDETWTRAALSATHKELHASVAQQHRHHEEGEP